MAFVPVEIRGDWGHLITTSTLIPGKGKLEWWRSNVLHETDGDLLISPADIHRVNLASDGTASVHVEANDSPNCSPANTFYYFKATINKSVKIYRIEALVADAALGIDLASRAEIQPGPAIVSYALASALAAEIARATAAEAGLQGDIDDNASAIAAKPDTFLELTDTPADYTGHAGEAAVVNATEDGLEFGAVAGGGASLSDAVPLIESGTGDAGTGTEASRDDHVHPAQDLSTYATVASLTGEATTRANADLDLQSDIDGAISTHEGAADPHSQYLTQTEGDARYGQLAVDNQWPAGQGIRHAIAGQAASLNANGVVGDTLPALKAGSLDTGYDQNGAVGQSDSGTGVYGNAPTGIGVQAVTTSGTAFASLKSAATNGAANLVRRVRVRLSSGTASAGLGSRDLYQAPTTTTADQDQAAVETAWSDPTHATATSYVRVLLRSAGAALAEAIRFIPGGLRFPDATTQTTAGDPAGTAAAAVTTHVGQADPHTQYALKSENLADLDDIPTARTNLGLGTAATADTGDFDAAGAADAVQADLDTHTALTTTAHGGIVASTDARLTDARTPTAHATSHVTGGSDVIPTAVAGGNAGLLSGADKTKLDNTSGTNTGDQTLPTDATIVTTDVTTNNVSSTKHGWAPKSPADATRFLNGAATPAYAQVKDSDLSTSDITTNDVSTTKHGFAPKAPNDTTKFLRGDGSWATPSGGGGGGGGVSTGALASLPAAGTADRLYMPTDDDIVFHDTGTDWEMFRKGQYVGLQSARPVVSSFTASLTAGGGSATDTKAGIYFAQAAHGSSDSYNLWDLALPSTTGPWTVTAYLRPDKYAPRNYNILALALRDNSGGSSNVFIWGMSTVGSAQYPSLTQYQSSSTAISAVDMDVANAWTDGIWLRIRDDGAAGASSRTMWAGRTLATLVKYNTVSHTYLVTPGKVGILIDARNVSTPNLDVAVTVPYFSVVNTAL